MITIKMKKDMIMRKNMIKHMMKDMIKIKSMEMKIYIQMTQTLSRQSSKQLLRQLLIFRLKNRKCVLKHLANVTFKAHHL